MHVADSTFSSFTGQDAPLAFVTEARAVLRRSSFRDLDLEEEIFDVSKGSAVHLEACTFTNVTVPNNEYVSTSYSDWEYFQGEEVQVTYYPEDDTGPLFDIQRSPIDIAGANRPQFVHTRWHAFFSHPRPYLQCVAGHCIQPLVREEWTEGSARGHTCVCVRDVESVTHTVVHAWWLPYGNVVQSGLRSRP